MATIKLQRTNEFVNRIRDYQIYIDGQKIGPASSRMAGLAGFAKP
jgi:hypothetical protein